jgi:hypothetical protein
MADYSEAWRSHRFWKRLPLLGMGFAFVLLIAMGQVPSLQRFDPLLPVFGVALVALFVVANVKLARFVCPRCKKRFNANFLGGGASPRGDVGKACGHCGLSLYGEA